MNDSLQSREPRRGAWRALGALVHATAIVVGYAVMGLLIFGACSKLARAELSPSTAQPVSEPR